MASLSTVIRDWYAVGKGSTEFRRTGKTPEYAYGSLIRLHCSTRGASGDTLNGLLGMMHPPASLPNANGVLGDLSKDDIAKAVAGLTRDGYFVFDKMLPTDMIARLMQFAQTTDARPIPRREGVPERLPYDPEKLVTEKYQFEEATLAANADIQTLMGDASLLAVSQAYLGLQPILDLVTMWWSTTFLKEASSEAAQLYHFDMDRIRWLKWFFYLTDVTTDTGPHCYVKGSHVKNGQPSELLDRGYVRIPDEDMEKHYSKDAFVEIDGKAGSIIAVDTRGFHKGKPLTAGHRLLVQFEYADSLFGTVYSRTAVKGDVVPQLKSLAGAAPRVFSKFDGLR